MQNKSLLTAVEHFHQWRRDLLLPGHQTASHSDTDPQLVLSSKMLKVFLQLFPEHRSFMAQLQVHFLEEDYTNRVKPQQWLEIVSEVDASS